MNHLRLVVAALALSFAVACGGKSTTPSTPTAPTTPTPTLTGITVTGPGCTGYCDATANSGTIQLTATARFSDGSTQSVTSSAQWTSANANVATVSSSGLVTLKNAGESDIVATYQGKMDGQTVRLKPAGPKTTFGQGQYLVGSDIAAGRYFADPPSSGCYWERQSGLGGTLAEIISNDFVGFNAAQLIVDILGTDRAFETDSDCGTWYDTPRHGAQATVSLGTWLVGSQVTPGTYRADVQAGCYWERLRNFTGELNGIVANDFVSSAGTQLVTIRAEDSGFSTDDDCGTWVRIGDPTSLGEMMSAERAQSPAEIERLRSMNRQRSGFPSRRSR